MRVVGILIALVGGWMFAIGGNMGNPGSSFLERILPSVLLLIGTVLLLFGVYAFRLGSRLASIDEALQRLAPPTPAMRPLQQPAAGGSVQHQQPMPGYPQQPPDAYPQQPPAGYPQQWQPPR